MCTHPRPSRRRGSILVITIWVVIILAALLLVFARSMRTEVISSGNRWAIQRAAAVEIGAEQYVLALAEAAKGDSTLVTDLAIQQVPVGDGYFWVLRSDPQNEANYIFGVSDEAAKVNVNSVDPSDLLKLPGMTQDVVDAIADWRDSNSEVTGQGAEDDYYTSLPNPYQCKNGALETVDELLLVKNFTPELLSGFDLNRDGVIDAREQNSGGGGLATGFNGAGGTTSRGLLPFLTVYTVDPNTTLDGQPRANMKTPAQPPATGGNPSGGGNSTGTGGTTTTAAPSIDEVLKELLPARADEILRRVRLPAGGTPDNLFKFANKGGLTQDELHLVADRITGSDQKTFAGLININTAPREVLLTLPGIAEADADKLIAARAGADLTSIAWAYSALGNPEKAGEIGTRVTGRSYQYSADILALSGDGRAFRRVRIVVDARTAPARIVYRRDLTDLGWPLDPEIRAILRRGERLTEISAGPGRITSGANAAVARAH